MGELHRCGEDDLESILSDADTHMQFLKLVAEVRAILQKHTWVSKSRQLVIHHISTMSSLWIVDGWIVRIPCKGFALFELFVHRIHKFQLLLLDRKQSEST